MQIKRSKKKYKKNASAHRTENEKKGNWLAWCLISFTSEKFETPWKMAFYSHFQLETPYNLRKRSSLPFTLYLSRSAAPSRTIPHYYSHRRHDFYLAFSPSPSHTHTHTHSLCLYSFRYIRQYTTKTNFNGQKIPLIHFIIFHFQFDWLPLSLSIDLTLAFGCLTD